MEKLLEGYSRVYIENMKEGKVVSTSTQFIKGTTEEEVLETLKRNNIVIKDSTRMIMSTAYVID
jgi:hypothetical protein